jgi:hypothetical protein
LPLFCDAGAQKALFNFLQWTFVTASMNRERRPVCKKHFLQMLLKQNNILFCYAIQGLFCSGRRSRGL